MLLLWVLSACAPEITCVAGPCDELTVCSQEVEGEHGASRYWVQGPEGRRWLCDGYDCAVAMYSAQLDICPDSLSEA